MRPVMATIVFLAFASGNAVNAAAECKIPASLTQCKACHALDPTKPSRATGPNLVGVMGQPAMHAADFTHYSEALKMAQSKGLIWNDENLMAYLMDPKAFLGTVNGETLKHGMMFQIKDEAKRKAAIEGLKEIAACK